MISKFSLCSIGKMISSLKFVCCKHTLTKEKGIGVRALYSCLGHPESIKAIIKCHRLSGLNMEINLLRVPEDQSLRSGCQYGGFGDASLLNCRQLPFYHVLYVRWVQMGWGRGKGQWKRRRHTEIETKRINSPVPLLIKALILLYGPHFSRHLLIYLPTAPSLSTTTMGIRSKAYTF